MVQSRAYHPLSPPPPLVSCRHHHCHSQKAHHSHYYCIAEEAMATVYRASYVSLHVRKSNRAALALYKDTLGFTVKDIEKKYCKCFQNAKWLLK